MLLTTTKYTPWFPAIGAEISPSGKVTAAAITLGSIPAPGI